MTNIKFRKGVYKEWSITISKDGSPLDMWLYDQIQFVMCSGKKEIIRWNATIIWDDSDWVITYNFSWTELETTWYYQAYFLFNNAGVSELSYPDTNYIKIEVTLDYTS